MLSLRDSSASPSPSPSPSLHRRNSIVVPTTTALRNAAVSSAPPPLSFELISLKAHHQAYTSLKDIIPSSPANSPTAAGAACSAASGYSIAIRNRLVKQAAWAYLQPMSASPTSGGPPLLRRLWLRLSSAASSCLTRLRRRVAGALDLVLRALRVRTDR